jgi:hypothetical protein
LSGELISRKGGAACKPVAGDLAAALVEELCRDFRKGGSGDCCGSRIPLD